MLSALPVRDARGAVIGNLRALTASDAEDTAMLESLTRWRAARGEWFLTRFQPTLERTRTWIANVVATDPTRRLFLLSGTDGVPVGTIGVLHLDSEPIEIDNILRGEKRGDPDLMFHALATVLAAAFKRHETANLFVLSNNERACALYRRLGFGDARRFALIPEQGPGELRLQRGPELAAPVPEPHLLEMVLRRAEFTANPS
jgi:RimJ/RimL family protein N-acetyltransferase